jgi:hypothetical protein
MKTVLPVKWDGELPTPERVTDERALELIKNKTHVYCPKAFYKQQVLGKPLGIQKETIISLVQARSKKWPD